MGSTLSFLDRIQDICDNIEQACSIESLYDNLAHYLTKISDAPASAFMVIAKRNTAEYAFQAVNGTGRYADAASSILHDHSLRESLSKAARLHSNYYSKGAVVFHFVHSENSSVLVYVEVAQEIDSESRKLLKFVNDKVASSIQRHSVAKQSLRTGRAMVIALAGLAEHKDQDTGDHIMRVAIMADEIVQVLEELGYYMEEITQEFKRHISSASILHDIGKVAIPDGVLKKSGKLDPEERRIIETHTLKGKKVLEKASRMLEGNNHLLNLCCEIALHHHEHYDGQGYPARIGGNDIPLSARIVGLADVFDALTSVRPYKKPWTQQEAVNYIDDQSGKQFDPLVIEAFHKALEYRQSVALIQWTDALSVKVDHMDADHRELIRLINQLASAEKIGNRRVAESVLDELLDYTIDHFDREEKFMQESNYPLSDLEAHKSQHKFFTETTHEIRWQYLHGFRPRINLDVLLFLRNWLNNHIMLEDMKYSGAEIITDWGLENVCECV